jgi:hypothetical protein
MTTVLVVASLLGNGLALARVPSMPIKKDCCAEMMGHKSAPAGDSDTGGKPCPSPNASCDDQCLLRCQSTVVLPMIFVVSPASNLAQAALPSLFTGERPLADSGPDLRPPIFV